MSIGTASAPLGSPGPARPSILRQRATARLLGCLMLGAVATGPALADPNLVVHPTDPRAAAVAEVVAARGLQPLGTVADASGVGIRPASVSGQEAADPAVAAAGLYVSPGADAYLRDRRAVAPSGAEAAGATAGAVSSGTALSGATDGAALSGATDDAEAAAERAAEGEVALATTDPMYDEKMRENPELVRRGGILIDISDRRLYFFRNGTIERDFPVAIPRHGELIYYGSTSVNRKAKWPGWTPTPNMRRSNPKLPQHVKGGPNNPLGARALYLGWPYIRIHGTNKPSSIGKRVTSGCFRMHNENVTWLYDQVDLHSQVKVQF